MFCRFLKGRLGDYDANRNQPPTNHVSHMSKYLHFGHISPIWLALEARKANAKEDYIESFVEELWS
jgi:deoxyribodipyrimidine photo-lyase